MNVKLFGLMLVLLAVTFESVGQLFLKKGAITNGINRWVAIGIAFLVVEVFFWTSVLHNIDLSMAYPMGSLSFVGVTLLSSFILKEKVSLKRWLGVGLIVGGTTLVGVF